MIKHQDIVDPNGGNIQKINCNAIYCMCLRHTRQKTVTSICRNHKAMMLQGANAAAPSNLLSKDAARLTQEQLDAVLTKQQSYVLHLRDVHISADLPRMFSRWSSDCSISGPDRNGDATITFQTGGVMKDAASFFGGGVRGKFKIDRSQTPEIK